MLFIETPIFTEDVVRLLDDEDYAELQRQLVLNPKAGPVIVGTGGLRKLRWRSAGRGKRGGVRVIYYDASREGQIRMLLIYQKGVKDGLSEREKSILRKLNEGWT